MTTFEYELTDTFCGEANYCWVNRGTVEANTERGAICKIARLTGYRFKYDSEGVYRGNGCNVICFLNEVQQ